VERYRGIDAVELMPWRLCRGEDAVKRCRG
jgi:hypothetical protein